MQTTEIISEYCCESAGIAAEIAKIEGGYSVVIKDLDCNKYYPVGVIYKDIESAKKAAVDIVANC